MTSAMQAATNVGIKKLLGRDCRETLTDNMDDSNGLCEWTVDMGPELPCGITFTQVDLLNDKSDGGDDKENE